MQCTIHVLTDLLRAFVQHMLFKKLCLSPVSNKINQVKSRLFLRKLHFGYTSGKLRCPSAGLFVAKTTTRLTLCSSNL